MLLHHFILQHDPGVAAKYVTINGNMMMKVQYQTSLKNWHLEKTSSTSSYLKQFDVRCFPLHLDMAVVNYFCEIVLPYFQTFVLRHWHCQLLTKPHDMT
jgi:hypothetical protein